MAAQQRLLLIEIQRELFDGGRSGEHVPMPSAYNWDVFNAGYTVFNAGAYNIDFGALDLDPLTPGTTIRLVDVPQTNDLDVTGYAGAFDAWELTGTRGGSPDSFQFQHNFSIFFPLVLDQDGDGVDVLPRMDSTVYFDIDSDGFLEQTAWMGAGDGMLVLDRPSAGGNGAGDGKITRIDELSYSTAPGMTDLEGLKAYDSNNDNVFNAQDTDWGRFRIWVDANRDGLTDAGELNTLAAWGITSYSLVRTTQRFNLADNSEVYGYSKFTMNGVQRDAADLALSYSTDGFINFHGINGVANSNYRTFIAEDGSSLAIRDYHTSSGNQTFTLGLPNDIQGVRAGAFNDTIIVSSAYTGETWTFGDTGNDTIHGGAGHDVMDGGTGANTMNGNAGDDTLYFNVWDIINGGSGYDTAILTIGNALSIDMASKAIESIVTSTGNDTITGFTATVGVTVDGRGGNDSINGSEFADVLQGGIGNDSIQGLGGDDLIVLGAGADWVQGMNGNDFILGGDGDDYLNGAAGLDRLFGQDGNDSILAGADNDEVSGGLGNDSLYGNSNDDTLSGGAGNDLLDGGGQYDWADYRSSASGATVNLLTGTANDDDGGSDTLLNFENVYGGDFADLITGSIYANELTGGLGNDTLHGNDGNDEVFAGEGADSVQGGEGNDRLEGGAGNDLIYGNFGYDTLDGGDGADWLIGGSANDVILGGGGVDTIEGGVGRDTVTGGTGADVFRFVALGDLTIARDKIVDFTLLDGDVIDLAGVDAITGVGDEAFVWMGTSAFTAAGQLRYRLNATGTATIVEGEVTGDGLVDFEIELTGNIALGASQFLL